MSIKKCNGKYQKKCDSCNKIIGLLYNDISEEMLLHEIEQKHYCAECSNKRITKLYTDKGIYCVECGAEMGKNYIGKAIDRLAHYEDLEEQGRLIELPCKVGDVWHEAKIIKSYNEICKIDKDCYFCGTDCEYSTTEPVEYREAKPIKFNSLIEIIMRLEHFGKTIFLTKEEAETALKEMIK